MSICEIAVGLDSFSFVTCLWLRVLGLPSLDYTRLRLRPCEDAHTCLLTTYITLRMPCKRTLLLFLLSLSVILCLLAEFSLTVFNFKVK